MKKITATVKDTLNLLAAKKTGEVERGSSRIARLPTRVSSTARSIPMIGASVGAISQSRDGEHRPRGIGPFSRRCGHGSRNGPSTTPMRMGSGRRQDKRPMLVIENTADDAVPQPHAGLLFEAASSSGQNLRGGDRCYTLLCRQPEHLHKVTHLTQAWLADRRLTER